jgi:hypothetical protein
MRNPVPLIVAGSLALPLILLAQTSNVNLPQDKGPATLNVSGYPPDIQKDYKVFSEKCAKCHTIARPINTTMSQAEWERYVKRMMHKPNSGINENQGKGIYDFLLYDQVQRKDKNPTAFFRALTDDEIEKLKAQQ